MNRHPAPFPVAGPRPPWMVCLLVALMVWIAGVADAREPRVRPNFVVVVTDDQGYGELGCHGNPTLKTPGLDRFHEGSARFTDFQVSPTCAPTRAALLTGRHEFKSGVTHTIFERERLSLKATTLAQVLQSGGYRTGIFGKWHLGDEPAYQPERRGFDEAFIHGGGGLGQTYPGSCGDVPGNGYFDPVIRHNGRFEKTRGYCTEVFFRQARQWMDEQRRAGAPFFALITPNAPHDPFVSPGPEYEQPFAGLGLTTRQGAYYAMIRHLDEQVGGLLDWLPERGLETNTLVVFMTDNGHSVPDLYNAGMRGAKGSVYQGGVRVPSFWRWPGMLPPGDRSQLAAHVDVLPTLAEFAGINLPSEVVSGLEGRSLVPVLRDPAAAWPERMLVTHVGRWPYGEVAAYKHRNAAIRDARFKLVNDSELYDLRADPGETRNAIGEHPEVVGRLRREYERWWTEMLPQLEHEWVIGPGVNPFKAAYWARFGGQPDEVLRRRMDPLAKKENRIPQ